jgi:hypothetical protein
MVPMDEFHSEAWGIKLTLLTNIRRKKNKVC